MYIYIIRSIIRYNNTVYYRITGLQFYIYRSQMPLDNVIVTTRSCAQSELSIFNTPQTGPFPSISP